MVEIVKVTRSPMGEHKTQSEEPYKARISAFHQAEAVRKASPVARLQRAFPNVSDEEARRFLLRVNFDFEKAVATLRERRAIVVPDEASSDSNHPTTRKTAEPKVESLKTSTAQLPTTEETKKGNAEVSVEAMTQRHSSAQFRSEGSVTHDVSEADNSVGNPLKRKKKVPDLSDPDPEIVEIIVRQQKFKIFESFIAYYCPGFGAVVNKGLFIPSENQPVTIDDVDPGVFRLFVRWLYSHGQKITESNGSLPPIPQLIELWIFGATVHAVALQNVVITALDGKIFCTSADGFNYLYKNTQPKDPSRRLFVDSVICRNMEYETFCEILNNHWDDIPQAMMKDVLLSMAKLARLTTSKPSFPPINIAKYKVKGSRMFSKPFSSNHESEAGHEAS